MYRPCGAAVTCGVPRRAGSGLNLAPSPAASRPPLLCRRWLRGIVRVPHRRVSAGPGSQARPLLPLYVCHGSGARGLRKNYNFIIFYSQIAARRACWTVLNDINWQLGYFTVKVYPIRHPFIIIWVNQLCQQYILCWLLKLLSRHVRYLNNLTCFHPLQLNTFPRKATDILGSRLRISHSKMN